MVNKAAYLILNQLLDLINPRADSHSENLSLLADDKNIRVKNLTENFTDVVEYHLV